VPVTWAKGIDMETGRPIVDHEAADWTTGPKLMMPGPLGGHNWMPMSFNPTTGLVYIPAQVAPALLVPDNDARWQGKGTLQLGSMPVALPEDPDELAKVVSAYEGRLIAWDPVAQKEVWRQRYPTIWNGGTLSTAGGLVFQGTANGEVRAYAADSGDLLWQSPANTGVLAGPVTYRVDGEQYVTFMVGWGGIFPTGFGGLAANADVKPRARVLTYRLDGKQSLPPADKRETTLAADVPQLQADEETVAQGRDLFNTHCGVCHGFSGYSGDVLPNLRNMPAGTHASFMRIVAGGTLSKRGMPAFADRLSEDEIDAIHDYLIKRQHDLKHELETAEAADS